MAQALRLRPARLHHAPRPPDDVGSLQASGIKVRASPTSNTSHLVMRQAPGSGRLRGATGEDCTIEVVVWP
jgi:hypothetical protein